MTHEQLTLPALVEWLESHINYEQTGPGDRHDGTHDPERRLRHLRRFMDIMDNPQDAYASIHVTGTNGKTSTSRMITQLVLAQGLRVGTITSPHLERLNERIAINGEPISAADLREVLLALYLLEPMLEDQRPSYFELLTAAAFRHFADSPVQLAVVEVGVGGTYDATNIIDGAVAVVTNVGLDHLNYLGPTRRDIATHKAGIVKSSSALVLGEPDESLHDLFLERTDSSSFLIGRDYEATNNRVAVGGRLIDLRTPGATYEDVYVALHGEHQAVNAATALMAAEAFFGQPLHEDVVREAFESVRSPGRLEVVNRRPLCVLDGAHNAAGASALASSLDEEFAVDGKRILVVGMLDPHDPSEILPALDASRARMVIACEPDTPRALPASAVAEEAKRLGVPAVAIASPVAAVQEALATAEEDDLVVITGSLYVVGAARTHFVNL